MNHKWTKEAAINKLKELADETIPLADESRLSENHTKWLYTTKDILEEIFGPGSKYYLQLIGLTWMKVGEFLLGGPAHPQDSWDPESAIRRKDHIVYLEDLKTARGLLRAAIDRLERSSLEDVYTPSSTPSESSPSTQSPGIVQNIDCTGASIGNLAVGGKAANIWGNATVASHGDEITILLDEISKTIASDATIAEDSRHDLQLDVQNILNELRKKQPWGDVVMQYIANIANIASVTTLAHKLGKIISNINL